MNTCTDKRNNAHTQGGLNHIQTDQQVHEQVIDRPRARIVTWLVSELLSIRVCSSLHKQGTVSTGALLSAHTRPGAELETQLATLIWVLFVLLTGRPRFCVGPYKHCQLQHAQETLQLH